VFKAVRQCHAQSRIGEDDEAGNMPEEMMATRMMIDSTGHGGSTKDGFVPLHQAEVHNAALYGEGHERQYSVKTRLGDLRFSYLFPYQWTRAQATDLDHRHADS
jgi:hypothetical protein